jgi:hypothetical protein
MTDEELMSALSAVRSNRRRKEPVTQSGSRKQVDETSVKVKVAKMETSKKALLLAALKELKQDE